MSTTMTGARLRCPTCGHTRSPKRAGIIIRLRAAGHEVIPTRILGRCENCDKLKFLISEPEDAAPRSVSSQEAAADRELTLQELAAYVSEDTMDIATVESIAAAACPEARKRHIAALVAEGVLKPADAIRLLAI